MNTEPENKPQIVREDTKDEPQLTPEDIIEIQQEPGDVTDIPIDSIEKEKLDQLRELLSKLPRDQAMQLIENLAKGHTNPVNPNNNMYSTTNKKEMLRHKLQQKLRQKQVGRMNKAGKQGLQRKYEEKMKVTEQQQADLAKQNQPKPDEASEIQIHPVECHDEHCNHDHGEKKV